jgi:MFS transporter, DHA3 family, macrolide efflux protein
MNKRFPRRKNLFVRHGRYRNLWLGQTISFFGNSVYSIAISWHVFEKTNSAVQVSMLLIAGFLPQVLFGALLGALADRWNRKFLMQVSDLLRAVATGLLAVSFFFGTFELWQIYVVTICLSLADLLFSNAQMAWLPEIVDESELLQANSLLNTSRQLNRLIGATAGGVLIAWIGAPLAIGLNALTFLISWMFLQLIPQIRQQAVPESTVRKSIWADMKHGFGWLRQQPVILLLVWIGMFSNVALGPTNVLPPMYIQSDLQQDATALGLFDAAIGLGLVLGGLLLGFLSPKRIGRWFLAGLTLQGIGMLAVAVAPTLLLACAGNFLLGLAVMMASLPLGTLIQMLTPSAMRGRGRRDDEHRVEFRDPDHVWGNRCVGRTHRHASYLCTGGLFAVLLCDSGRCEA